MVMCRSSPEPTSFAQYGELAIPEVNEGGGKILARGLPALIEFDSLEQAIRAREG
jgi:hypothetical protein